MASTQSGSLRHRGGGGAAAAQGAKKDKPAGNDKAAEAFDNLAAVVPGPRSDWDFKLAGTVLTLIAMALRFWGINHPDQVVFDEVHFGKVSLYGLPMMMGLAMQSMANTPSPVRLLLH